MRILTVADIPVLARDGLVLTEDVPPVDLVLSCGDLDYSYLRDLSAVFDAPLYYVKGNHDLRTAEAEGEIHDGCFNIHGKVVVYGGLRILGIEGSMWYNGGDNQYTEGQVKRILRQIKTDLRGKVPIDIVLTHAPPRHIHDREDLCHRGFTHYRRFIERYNPRFFVHGHVHDSFSCPEERITLYRRTTVINACGYHILEVDHAAEVH